jgi:endonuclease YncB( thermonuclease family)|nr:MAG TPA: nuclease-like protein [Caudoviricetes sp.]DAY54455.1 MAG TPA: nuclease-like protein [Caudoviricetes sp.]
MLNAGMAWHYTKYDQSEKYHNAEIKARNNKVGLWVYPRRIAPWDFR